MDSIAQLTYENGIFAFIGALIGFVLSQLFTISKIRKVNAERKKLLAETIEKEERLARQREVWEEEDTAVFAAHTNIIPAKKTVNSKSNQFERLDDESFFKAVVLVKSFCDKPIIVEEVRFIGQEKFVDGGYGASKHELEKVDKQMLREGDIAIKPWGIEELSFDYCIGRRFNDRMKVDVFVKARVGNKSPSSKEFSLELVYIY